MQDMMYNHLPVVLEEKIVAQEEQKMGFVHPILKSEKEPESP